MMWYGGFGWMGIVGSLMMLLFWGGAAVLVVWAIRSFSGPARRGDDALDTLRRRLASGEISHEEFEQSRKLLQG